MSNEYGKPKYVAGGIIRPRGKKFVAEVNNHGERRRKTFANKDDAAAWIKSKNQAIRTQGTQALRLTEPQMVDAVKAIKIADGAVHLSTAVEFWMSHNQPKGGTRTVLELYNEYYQTKVNARRRAATLTDLRNRVGKFATDPEYSDLGVHEVTPGILEKYITALDAEPLNQWNYARALRSFFRYGVKRNLIEYNPAEDLEKPTIDETLPEFMPVKDVKKVLREAELKHPQTAITLAIQFFAGLRTSEAVQIVWSDIDLEEKIIRVRPEVSKKHRSRNVDIQSNLHEWLVRHRAKSGNISPPYMTFRRHRRDIVKKTGVVWPNNACRHSYATYHLAKFEDASKTALQLGHKDIGVLYNHYRGLAKRDAAEAYWKIKPQIKRKVVQFEAMEAM